MKLLRLSRVMAEGSIIINVDNINYFKPYSHNSYDYNSTIIYFCGDDEGLVVGENFEEVVSLLETFEE